MTLAIFIILSSFLSSQQDNPELSFNNFGNEFVMALPPNLSPLNPNDQNEISFILFSPFDTEVFIEIPAINFYETVKLKKNRSEKLIFDSRQIQVFQKTGFSKFYTNFVVKNSSVRFHSNKLFSLVVLSDFKETADALLAIPTESLGKKYIISSWKDISSDKFGFNSLPAITVISALNDNTEIAFTYGENDNALNLTAPSVAGRKISNTLQKGDVWVLTSVTENGDLSGSIVESNQAISVVSSNQCATIPNNNGYCNFILGMEIPTELWGNEYLISSFFNKKYNPLVRVYSIFDSTQVTINNQNYIIPKAGGDLSSLAFLEINSKDNLPYIIKSDKPINAISLGRGIMEDETDKPILNPVMLHNPPLNKLQKQILISPAGADFYQPFKDNFINIIFKIIDEKGIDEILFQEPQLNSEWKNINQFGELLDYQELANNGNKYGIIKFKFPYMGNFQFKCEGGLLAYIYGNNYLKSYAYPASYPLNFQDDLDTSAPVITYSQDCAGKINGFINDESSPIKYTLIEDDSDIESFNVCDKNILPVCWNAKVKNPNEETFFNLRVWDRFNNSSITKINYKPIKIKFNPEIIDFGEIHTNQEYSKDLWIHNYSDSTYFLDDLQFEDFIKIYQNGIPIDINRISVNPNDSILLKITFNSKIDSVFNSFILFSDNCQIGKKINWKANSNSPIINAEDGYFDYVSISQSKGIEVSISNTGKRDLEIYKFTLPNNEDFQILNLPFVDSNNPLIIKPNTDFKLKIVYQGYKTQIIYDSLTISSNASKIDSIIYLNVIVINPGLIANGYNWGIRKVNIPGYNFGNYKPDFPITIQNTGKSNLTIDSISFDISKYSEAFLGFENLSEFFKGFTLNKDSLLILDIIYNPEKLDTSIAEISFYYNGGIKSQSKLILAGISSRPKITIEVENPPPVIINDPLGSRGKIKINNLNLDKWIFSDSVEHLNIQFDKIIAQEAGIYLDEFQLQRTLYSNEEIEIPFHFKPINTGRFVLNLGVESDAIYEDQEFQIVVNAYSDTYLIDTIKIISDKCPLEIDTLAIKILNKNNGIISFNPIKFEPPSIQFRLLDYKFNNDFDIGTGSLEEILIEYIPLNVNEQVKLIVSQKLNSDQDTIDLIGFGEYQIVDLKLKTNKSSINTGEKQQINFTLDADEIKYKEGSTQFKFALYYNQNNTFIDTNSIYLSTQNPNLKIENINLSEKGVFYFEIINTENNQLKDLESIDLTFLSLLSSPENMLEHFFQIKFIEGNYNCIDFVDSELLNISISEDCNNLFRGILVSEFDYNLISNISNPVSNSFKLEFTIPFNEEIKFEVYTSDGSQVFYSKTKLNKGLNHFDVDVNPLSNGIYFYKISSQNWNKVNSFVVDK